MPTLDWIGKKAVENHHKEVPYRLLKCDPALSVGEPGSGNLLVQGDNLEALKALLPYYAARSSASISTRPTTRVSTTRTKRGGGRLESARSSATA